MGVTRTTDGNIELITIHDDAGADFNEVITFPSPVEIVRIKMEKPGAGTLVINSVTHSPIYITGPTTVVESASMATADTTYYNNSSNLVHSLNLEGLTVIATGCGAGVHVSISAQSLISEEGRDF